MLLITNYIAIPIFMWLVVKPLIVQAKRFLLIHDPNGPPLSQMRVFIVSAIFTLVGTSLLLRSFESGANYMGTAKSLIMLAWGIPLVLLDLHKCWLPLCFTNGFWISGVLFTLLPDNPLSWNEALINSCAMFAALYAFRYVAEYIRGNDGFGLGDVHLIAGLYAWFPWQLACLLSGFGFLLFIIVALLTQNYTQPYAPWLFVVLAILVGCLP